jgi:hypothetical protein
MLGSGGVWYGGHGAFRLGIVGFGWSRRSTCVEMGHGVER